MAKVTNTAARLAEYMRIFDKRQTDLVEEAQATCIELGIKLNKSDLSQYASGKVEPGGDKVYLLSKAFGLNPAWLMGYDVEMYSDNEKPPQNAKEEKPADEYDELDHIIADRLGNIRPELAAAIVKLSPQGLDSLLEYAEFLLKRESNASSEK